MEGGDGEIMKEEEEEKEVGRRRRRKEWWKGRGVREQKRNWKEQRNSIKDRLTDRHLSGKTVEFVELMHLDDASS